MILFLFSSIATAAAPPPPTTTAPQIGSIPFAPQQTAGTTSSAPNVIYVPRNVYVPVIKPVFVPRERKLSIFFFTISK